MLEVSRHLIVVNLSAGYANHRIDLGESIFCFGSLLAVAAGLTASGLGMKSVDILYRPYVDQKM